MSSGFITETEAAEVRKRRQEEWDRVRKADDPIVRPEEPFDSRSLYDKLQEQKQKKDLEYEEAHKLKNMIKGLDDDEIEFLDLVDRTKIEADRKKELEEEQELLDYRNRVAILQEKSLDERIQADIVVNKSKTSKDNRNSQQKLLKGIVIKKSDSNKRKMEEGEEKAKQENSKRIREEDVDETGDKQSSNSLPAVVNGQSSALTCVAVLPGLGCYQNSSSEDDSSDSDTDSKPPSRTDLLGRKVGAKDNSSSNC
nr:protein FAM192A [Leptinotarsa decemlineata]